MRCLKSFSDNPSPMEKKASYRIKSASLIPALDREWESGVWRNADTLEIRHFRPESSGHRPRTEARLLYNDEGVFGLFRVEDRYVRSVHTEYGDPVCKDSCVEFFVQPKSEKGYFNFEFNCGGTLLCCYITDHERVPGGFKGCVPVSPDDGGRVIVFHSMPRVVEPEIAGHVVWTVGFFIPFALLEKYLGPLGRIQGQEWRANFYKCGDETSHPHWSSWMPLDERNFHLPHCFGAVRFE